MIAEADLDAIFTALADPTRRAIISRLTKGDASVLELAEPFKISQPAVTKHLNVLERAGLISRRREGQRRPCKLEPNRFAQLAEWIGNFREFYEESFDRLDEYLEELKKKEKSRGKQTRAHHRTR
jgi:DNA-binding transcriptional ArsR family regulator